MSMKTILVPMDRHDGNTSALETALILARKYDSYIEGFALRWATDNFVYGDIAIVVPLEKYQEEVAAEARRTQQVFESFMQQHNVPSSTATTALLSFGWLNEPAQGESVIGSHGRAFDLIVMNRPDANSTGLYRRALESGLFESGRPLLLSPPLPPKSVGTRVMIAWNGSTEQTLAIALAMPLLEHAENVKVLTVTGGTGVPGPSAAQIIRHLQRNGVAAEPANIGLDGKSTGEAILIAAQNMDCDLLIKGAFTQSRLRQMIFGGATQHVMMNATLPVLLAH